MLLVMVSRVAFHGFPSCCRGVAVHGFATVVYRAVSFTISVRGSSCNTLLFCPFLSSFPSPSIVFLGIPNIGDTKKHIEKLSIENGLKRYSFT